MSLISPKLRAGLRQHGWLKIAASSLAQEGFTVPETLNIETLSVAFGEKLAREMLDQEAIEQGLLALQLRRR